MNPNWHNNIAYAAQPLCLRGVVRQSLVAAASVVDVRFAVHMGKTTIDHDPGGSLR